MNRMLVTPLIYVLASSIAGLILPNAFELPRFAVVMLGGGVFLSLNGGVVSFGLSLLIFGFFWGVTFVMRPGPMQMLSYLITWCVWLFAGTLIAGIQI